MPASAVLGCGILEGRPVSVPAPSVHDGTTHNSNSAPPRAVGHAYNSARKHDTSAIASRRAL